MDENGKSVPNHGNQDMVECVKARLLEEGREARNLIAYSLPVRKPKPPHSKNSSESSSKKQKGRKKLSVNVSSLDCKQDKRPRSASAGRDPQASLRARHWGFLFRNLEQAVGEIYQTCEDDESIIECKEAILMLERYASDFYKLIEWLKLKWEYENTPPLERPTSLSWEIRTSCPRKTFQREKKVASLPNKKVSPPFDQQSVVSLSKTEANVPSCDSTPCTLAILGDIEEQGIPNSIHSISDHKEPLEQIEESNESQDTFDRSIDLIGNPSSKSNVVPSEAAADTDNDSVQVAIKNEPISKDKHESNICVDKKVIKSTKRKYTNAITSIPDEKLSQKQVMTQHLQGNGCNSCNMREETGKFIFMDDDRSEYLENVVELKVENISQGTFSINVQSDEKKPMLSSSTEELTSKKVAKILPNNAESNNNMKSKSTSFVRSSASKPSNLDVKVSGNDSHQSKGIHAKPVPLVNMNKASQVRKAYNQSKTPQKAPCSNAWKSNSPSARVPLRRGGEGKTPWSPPAKRRLLDGGKGHQCNTGHPVGMERCNSSISFRVNKKNEGLLRSSTTLTESEVRKNDQCFSDQRISSQIASCTKRASSSSASSSGQSWADKVRGGCETPNNAKQPESQLSLQDVEDGWEVVRRGRRSQNGSSASLNIVIPATLKNNNEVQQRPAPNKFHLRNRFHQPSSAVSMPSLADNAVINDSSATTATTEPSTPRHETFNDTKSVQTSRREFCNETKSNGGTDNKKPKEKNEISYLTKEFKTPCNISADEEANVSTEKHRKNLTNNCKKNEIKKASPLDSEAVKMRPIIDSSPSLPGFNEEISDNEQKPVAKLTSQDSKKKPSIDDGSSSTISSGDDEEEKRKQKEKNDDDDGDDSESDVEDEKIRTNAAALECAAKEERRLKLQIEEAEKDSIEVTEEAEVINDDATNVEDSDVNSCEVPSEAYSAPQIEPFYNYNPNFNKLSKLSWAEETDAIEKMDSLRHPGRVLHIHEKLSSPSRKLPLSEKFRRHREKLAKAEELRSKMIQAKTEKLKDLFKKINEVNKDKDRLLLEKRKLFERKMERAEEKRKRHLQEIINKAHDEDNKAREIAFINGLEAQNKWHDIMQQHQSHESRLADMAEERCRKQEEKAAKEFAAQERRKALEAGRQARMEELCEKRRKRCERIDRQQAERREELLEQAREKARDREERLSALQQAQQAKETELVKKIQQKQEETARRHEENIEQIRQKALESSIMRYSRGGCDDAPKLLRYETKKLCTLCSSLIASDVYLLSHLRGKQHQEALKELYKNEVSNEETVTYNLKHIIDAPASIDDPEVTRDKERQKALKKRYRKLRTRMMSRGREFLAQHTHSSPKDTTNKSRLSKGLQQIGKLLNNQGSGPWPSSDVNLLDRHLLEIIRILEKKMPSDQDTFAALDGLSKLSAVLSLITDCKDGESCVVPSRSLGYCGKALLLACHASVDNCRFLLFSNVAGNAVEQLLQRLTDLSNELVRSGSSSSINTLASFTPDPVAVHVMEFLAEILNVLRQPTVFSTSPEGGSTKKDDADAVWQRLQDIISYCVSIGIVDKITWYFNNLQNPIENDLPSADFITAAMSLLSSLTRALIGRNLCGDPTQLIGTIHVTEACGVVSLLYGLLLHQGGRSSSPPPHNHLTTSTLAITATAATLLQNLAELDLSMFQGILGSEGISLEFRHIGSFLLWYCSHWPCEEVLHNIISIVGFFTIGNKENQAVVQSGETPSVLQQLCSLPWQYFSEPRLTSILFPTLLACCWENPQNMDILLQEMSFQVLEDFIKSDQGQEKPLVLALRQTVLHPACLSINLNNVMNLCCTTSR